MNSSKFETVQATRAHAKSLAGRLSEEDMFELRVTRPGIPASIALEGSIRASRDASALINEAGDTLAIWGVSEQGEPWMLATHESAFSQSATVNLVRECRKSVARWLLIWNQIGFRMHAASSHHKKLVKLVGFTVGKPYFAGLIPYCDFWKEADYVRS